MEPTTAPNFFPFDPSFLSGIGAQSVGLGIFKIAILLGLGIYVVFALVVLRQITLMARTVKTDLETPFKIFGIAHLFLSIALWIFALLAL